MSQLLSIFFLAISLIGCTTVSEQPKHATPTSKTEIAPLPDTSTSDRYAKTALLLPLSGPHQEVGRALKDAASLALSVTDHVELSIYDTGNTPEQAKHAMEEAIAGKPSLIFGPLFAHTTEEVKPLALAARIPLISFSNNRAIAGRGTLSFGFQPSEQVEQVLHFAGNRGISEFFLLLPAGDFGKSLEPTIRREIQALGGVLIKIEYYTDQPDTQEIAAKNIHDSLASYSAHDAMEAMPRGVIIVEGGHVLANLMVHLNVASLPRDSIRLLGSGQWDDPATLSIPGTQGAWFASASLSKHQTFIRMFTERYHYQPSWIASLAFDAIGLAQVVAQQMDAPQGSSLPISEILLQQQGFSGIDGIFRFTKQGYTERGLAIIEIAADPVGFKELVPAPEHF